MSGRAIEAAALRWHAARLRRLEVGGQIRRARSEAVWSVLTSPALRDLERQHADAKRAERLALSSLTKACQKSIKDADDHIVDV